MTTTRRTIRRNSKEAKAILARATQAVLCGGGDSILTTLEEIREAYAKFPHFQMFVEADGTAYIQGATAAWDLI